MSRDSGFERVRREVASNLVPVTPLRSPWKTALVALPLVVATLSLVLVYFGLRSDAEAIGPWPLWGPATLMILAAYGALVMALAQRSPETTVSWVWWTALPVAVVGLQLGGAYWTYLQSQPPLAGGQSEAMCFWRVSLLGLPSVLIVLWLLSRGFPLRPKVAALTAGTAGGVLAEGIYRLHCGLSHPSHIVTWHTGAVLVMGLLGLLTGLWWERRRLDAWPERAQG